MGPSNLRRRVTNMADNDRFAPADAITDLVAGALSGHEAAWEALVERLQRVVWKSVNMMTYDREIRDDAFAATWLRLAERLDSIREPEKLPGWLTTTACNEVRQIVRQRGRDHLSLTESWAARRADRSVVCSTRCGRRRRSRSADWSPTNNDARYGPRLATRRAVSRDHHGAGAGRPAAAVRRGQRAARPPDRFARAEPTSVPRQDEVPARGRRRPRR